MTHAVYNLGAIFDAEVFAKLKNPCVVLCGAGHDVRQGNPAAASVNQQAEDSSALSFGVRSNRKPLYRLRMCLMLSHLSCRPAGASRSQRSPSGLPSLSSYAVSLAARCSGFGILRTR